MDDREVGQRIAHWRRRRGLTQSLFADRIGKSKSWVEKVERGSRRASLAQLEQITAVLRVDLSVLIRQERPSPASECLDGVEVGRLRDALLQYEAITATFSQEGSAGGGAGMKDVGAAVRHCWMGFQASSYSMLGRSLPALIAAAQQAVREQPADSAGEARGLLSQAYQLAASTLRKSGEPGLEVVAAERALVEAERAGNPLLAAGASFRLANAVLDMGDSERAVAMAATVAGKLARGLTRSSADLMSLYGHILLQGAMAAARHEDRAAVRDFLAEADVAASQLGRDGNAFYVAFGPTNVGVHRVSALVLLGEGELALEAARDVSVAQIEALPRERRATHMTTVAVACSQAGRRDDAVGALLDAERIGAEEVRCREPTRELIADLLGRARGKPSYELSGLAERAGVSP